MIWLQGKTVRLVHNPFKVGSMLLRYDRLLPFTSGLDGELCVAEGYSELLSIWDSLSDSYNLPLRVSISDYENYIKKLSDNAITLCFCRNNSVLGAISFYANDYDGKYAYVSQIAVHDDAKRSGIGTLLLNSACYEASLRGMNVMQLEVLDDNRPARAMYKEMGFIPSGNRGRYGDILFKAIAH